MLYSYENKCINENNLECTDRMFEYCINENINTFSVFQVDKMPDKFLEVEFIYPRSMPWKTCIPIYEKYQGINLVNAPLEDVEEWIEQCYEDMSPANADAWTRGETRYWEEHGNANKAKPLFDVLNHEDRYHCTSWGCRQCTDTSRVNSQAASRIRALKKDHGYHIASKDMHCPVCNEVTKHDMLLRIPRRRGNSQTRYTISSSLKRRIKERFDYTDACFDEKYSSATQALVIDHKFPATRWAAGETHNFSTMSDAEIDAKFQLLTQQTNLQKDRYCFRCYNEGIRGDFFGIKWYPYGDERWNGANNSDENGCLGCPWYDLKEWKERFNEYLSKDN